jgi:hypothetical protein
MRNLPTIAVAAALFALAGQVQAATLTRTFDFIGTGPFFPDPAPTDPMTGSFTVTFDPTLAVTDQTAGVTLHALNVSADSQIGYDYDPVLDRLTVGGMENGAAAVFGFSNDWGVYIGGAAGLTPTLFVAYYTTATIVSPFQTETGSLAFQDGGAGGGVPEPGVWAYLLSGFGALGSVLRRGARRRAFAP